MWSVRDHFLLVNHRVSDAGMNNIDMIFHIILIIILSCFICVFIFVAISSKDEVCWL